MKWLGSGGWLPAFWGVRNLCALYLPAEHLREIFAAFDKLFDAIAKAQADAYDAGKKEGREG